MRLTDKRKDSLIQTGIAVGSPAHILLIGKTGSGKTVCAEMLVYLLFKKGYKIVSLYNTWRWESAFWTFPAQGEWQTRMNINGKDYALETTSLPIRVHVPISSSIPKNLPKICNLFTIPIYEMNDYEIAFLGSSNPSPVQIALNKLALKKMKFRSTIIKFILAVRKLVRAKRIKVYEDILDDGRIAGIDFPSPFGKSTYRVITRNITDYLNEPIVSSGENPHAIDLKSILNDNSYVSVFATAHLPFNLMCLTISYLLRKIFDLAKQGKISVPIVIYIDEARDIFPREPDNPILNKVRSTGFAIARGARGCNLSLLLSTQSPLDLYEPIRRQMMTKYIFWMDDPSDLTFLKEGGRKLRPEELETLATFESGECFVMEQAQPLRYMRVVPPPFHHRMPTDDFFKMWRKFGGETFPTTPYIEDVKNEKRKDLEEYKSYSEEEKREEMERKIKKRVLKVKDYDRVMGIIQSYYKIRKMEFTRNDIQESNPELGGRNVRDILSKMESEGILKRVGKGRATKFRIIRI